MTAKWLVRFVVWAGWIACLGAISLSLAFSNLANRPAMQWSPWLCGLLLLGIPHGALDHRVAGELRSDGGEARASGAGFYAVYLAAVGLVLWIWFVSPLLASAGFLLVAAAHFGQGDVYWSRRYGLAARTRSRGYRASLLVARAAVPIVLPLVAFPGVLSGTADALAGRLFGKASWSIPTGMIPCGAIAIAMVVGVQVLWAAWLAFVGDRKTKAAAFADIAETFLLVATFAIVPPVLALGVYFNAWHSLRHVARLMVLNRTTRNALDSGRLLAAFVRFQKAALPMTCGALVLVVGLGLMVSRSVVSVVDLGLIALVGLSALTLPHVLVVCWMDAQQGVWSPRPEQG